VLDDKDEAIDKVRNADGVVYNFPTKKS
jgi:hypothetical protein